MQGLAPLPQRDHVHSKGMRDLGHGLAMGTPYTPADIILNDLFVTMQRSI